MPFPQALAMTDKGTWGRPSTSACASDSDRGDVDSTQQPGPGFTQAAGQHASGGTLCHPPACCAADTGATCVAHAATNAGPQQQQRPQQLEQQEQQQGHQQQQEQRRSLDLYRQLYCPLCCQLMEAAVQLQPCRHGFCATCLSQHLGAQLQAGVQLSCPWR